MQLLRSDPAGAERRRGGSLVREKGGAEELTSEQDSFSALNYQQFLREKTFICAKSAVRLFSGFTNTPSTLTLCCTAETHSQPFVTSSFNDVPEEKNWNFHLHQHSSIAHEYFRGMWVVCHGPRLDCISTLSWSSSNDGRAEQAKTNPPSHHHQHLRIWSGAVNHLVDGRTLDARRRGVIAVLLQDIQNDSYM